MKADGAISVLQINLGHVIPGFDQPKGIIDGLVLLLDCVRTRVGINSETLRLAAVVDDSKFRGILLRNSTEYIDNTRFDLSEAIVAGVEFGKEFVVQL